MDKGKDLQKPQTKKKGICCVCKETKSVRDECILFKSEESCKKEIQNHIDCLKSHGFSLK